MPNYLFRGLNIEYAMHVVNLLVTIQLIPFEMRERNGMKRIILEFIAFSFLVVFVEEMEKPIPCLRI